MQRLMIADDSDVVRKVGKRILSGMGFLVSEAANGLEALARCQTELPNIIIVDAALDGALDLIGNIRRLPEGKSVRIYYCVVEADLKKMMAGKRAGADDFLLKPFDRKILTNVFASLSIAA
ncbi:response regulator [Pararhizobium arenae]|jgi:two-component system chemotaxis response regulator CheY|uniref:response regulator n=1 Tax=Pararhizobium arenae TaxID=1856850 RepID=UPI00094AF632|nr:response regulator [Pararhizobium arenae]